MKETTKERIKMYSLGIVSYFWGVYIGWRMFG